MLRLEQYKIFAVNSLGMISHNDYCSKLRMIQLVCLLVKSLVILGCYDIVPSSYCVCPVLQSHSWQPGIKNPYRGVVVWPVPENIEITVTLFKVCLQMFKEHWDTHFHVHVGLGWCWWEFGWFGAMTHMYRRSLSPCLAYLNMLGLCADTPAETSVSCYLSHCVHQTSCHKYQRTCLCFV